MDPRSGSPSARGAASRSTASRRRPSSPSPTCSSDPHWRARKTFIEVVHPLGFPETIYGAYVKTSRSRVEVRPGPRMGQDNERVLRGLLGLGEDEYRRLLDEKVIG